MAIAYISDKGPKRADNQDAVGAYYNQSGEALVLVADGVASNPGSKQASQMVVETLGQAWEKRDMKDQDSVKDWLVHQADLANNAILLAGKKNPVVHEMATTLVLAVCLPGEILIANAGDSRAYLLRDKKAKLLTFDHTVRNELKRNSGQIYDESLPEANSLTRYLGVNQKVGLEWTTFTPKEGDWLYLTSDGLSKVLDIDDQVALLQPGMKRPGNLPPLGSVLDLTERIRALIRAAVARHAPDNITALLVTDLTNPNQQLNRAGKQPQQNRFEEFQANKHRTEGQN
ncbi:protein serine/threonine phosphatase PrpC,regulation of stationary phase [Fructobacillus pseudoficulneus]|uniref:Protein serine/threonine phosphatase PrpC,regulation of stationary phase n=1 Tax=Fructobacillus pseudoficulneus TaxID=220714 RepID=A0A3F3H8V5_9LACO|nr:protein phosphatase 2C domain-containing protein [Fructobacillus pseudoficulneus]GAP02753.1 protein serine/threonine phosphatase PrpC,regulation of stationary phase [Fructobacillus pseudoficulneus]SEH39641.1 protein phosphatase [Fructobacillus pseudoficulneus]